MRHRTKALWVLLLAVILVVVNSSNVGIVKASPTRVSVDYFGKPTVFNTQLVPGTQFTINLTVDYVEELWGYQFTFRFNPAVLQGVSYKNGPFLSSAGGSILWAKGTGFNNTAGTLGLFSAALFPKEKFPTGGGVLASITFQVKGYGASPIKFELNSGLSNKTGGWIIHLSEMVWDTVKQKWVPRWPPHTPEAFVDGLFDNRPPIKVSPSRIMGVVRDEIFSINVSVADMKEISGWSFSLNWTAGLLNVTGVREGDMGSFAPPEISNETGYIRIVSSTVVSRSSGTLANITFLVTGLGKSDLILYNTQILDSAGQPIPIRTENGFFDNSGHDISIIDITPDPPRVKAGQGEIVNVNVTLQNVGAFSETGINVTTYYDATEIGKQTAIPLEKGEVKTLTFPWNTTGIPPGKYKIKAVATPVVNETYTADNTYFYRGGWVTIWQRNLAVISVTTPVSRAFSGYHVMISVTVINKGTEIETFNVTAYANSTTSEHTIDTQAIKELDGGYSRVLTFTWNLTADVALGNYTIKAVATPVEGESDVTDNTCFKVDTLEIIAFKEEFPTELAALSIVAVVVVGSVIFFVKRRKPAEPEAEAPQVLSL